MSESKVLRDVERELASARRKFPRVLSSAHEGYAVIVEELDELWDEIKGPDDSKQIARMRAEAIQVAAMAVRFVEDLCDR